MEEKTNAELIKEITNLTLHIKKTYPDLYNQLAKDSSLKSIPSTNDNSVFMDYLNRLNTLVENHRDSQN